MSRIFLYTFSVFNAAFSHEYSSKRLFPSFISCALVFSLFRIFIIELAIELGEYGSK